VHCRGHVTRAMKIVKPLLERKDIQVNLAKTDGSRTTPLINACRRGHGNIVKLLLERKDIQINLSEVRNVFTPLMHACLRGKEDVVKLLLEREDINIRADTKWGKTAYDLCDTDGSLRISEAVRNRLKP
jgi:ankyrin repeat protein